MAAEALIQSDPLLRRVRRLSPLEVWSESQDRMVKLPAWAAVEILKAAGNDIGVERRVRSGLFTVQEKETAPVTLRFNAEIETPHGMRRLAEDETYLTFLSPFHLDKLFVCERSGAFLGECPRWHSVMRGDDDALRRQFGQVRRIEADLLAPVAARGRGITRQRMADMRHNSDVLRRAITGGETGRRLRGGVGELLGAPPAARDDPDPAPAFSSEELL